jgi:hypothetical protein
LLVENDRDLGVEVHRYLPKDGKDRLLGVRPVIAAVVSHLTPRSRARLRRERPEPEVGRYVGATRQPTLVLPGLPRGE